MTRGQIIFWDPDGKVHSSGEFNGDMYLNGEGHGEEVVEGLKSVSNYDDYFHLCCNFRDKNFARYGSDFIPFELSAEGLSRDELLNMSEDYFGKYFSDYLYILNGTSEDLVFSARGEEDGDVVKVRVSTGDIFVANYGRPYIAFRKTPVKTDGKRVFTQEVLYEEEW